MDIWNCVISSTAYSFIIWSVGYMKLMSKPLIFGVFFMQTVSSNLTDYDAEGAWPYLIDEFVDYLNENGVDQHGQINDSSLKRWFGKTLF